MVQKIKTIYELFKEDKYLPKPITYPYQVDTLYIHDGAFHMDDVLFAALIKVLINPDVEIIRTRLIDTYSDKNAIFADVGKLYDGYKYYDHHQLEYTDPTQCRSSVGLFWDDWGDKTNYQLLHSLIDDCNKHDTGLKMSLIGSLVSACNSPINDEDHNIAQFYHALNYMIELVNTAVLNGINKIKIMKVIQESRIHNNIVYLPYNIRNIRYYMETYLKEYCDKNNGIKGFSFLYEKTKTRYIYTINNCYFPSEIRYNSCINVYKSNMIGVKANIDPNVFVNLIKERCN